MGEASRPQGKRLPLPDLEAVADPCDRVRQLGQLVVQATEHLLNAAQAGLELLDVARVGALVLGLKGSLRRPP